MKRSFVYWSILLFLIIGYLTTFFLPEGKHALGNGAATAVDYYVDVNNGTDDPSHGTSSSGGAWKTLHYAIDRINAREPGAYVLHVASGDYNGANGEDLSRTIVITQSNLAIVGEETSRPVLRGEASWATALEVAKGTENVTINHLEITGFNLGSSAISVAGHNIWIQSCDINKNSEGIRIISGRNDTVHIFENEISGSDVGISNERSTKLIIERNSLHDNNIGIVTQGGMIKNNVVYDNQMTGIEAGAKTSIYYNTLDGGERNGAIGIFLPDGKAAPTIACNIITGFDVGIQRDKGKGKAVLNYNDLWNNGLDYEGVVRGPHDISEDPCYSDPEHADFKLQEGSPCIDAIPYSEGSVSRKEGSSGDGSNSPDENISVTEDFNRTPRPQGRGYDIGAHEVQAVVDKAVTTTDVLSSWNPSTYGQSLTFTATVTSGAGTPTGTVTFRDGATLLGTEVLDAGGQATITTLALSAGSHTITAEYGGDSNFEASTSLPLTQTVNKCNTTTLVMSDNNPSAYGDSVTFTVNVTPIVTIPWTPTGTVTFRDGATLLGTGELDAGQATFSTSLFSVGSHSITAVYGGDGNFNGSTSIALPQTVNKVSTSTSVTSDNNPSTYGQPVTFTATVEIGWAAAAKAMKGGLRGPLKSGKKVVPTMIADTATGTVQFKIDGSDFGAPVALSGGSATSGVTSSLSVGNHTVTAVYSGDGNYDTSTGTLTPDQTVDTAGTSTSVTSDNNPSTYGQPVTFTATVEIGGAAAAKAMKGGLRGLLKSGKRVVPTMIADTATGTVQFKIDGSDFGAPVALSGGSATSGVTSSLSAGNHTVTAVYSGDGNFNGSTSDSITQTVNALGALSVTPPDALNSSGNQVGLFAPSTKDYTLQNTSGVAINWAVTKTAAWVSLSTPSSGTLNPGASQVVTVSINSSANSLIPGSYSDTITFTNSTNGNGNTARGVSLSVDAPPGALSVGPADWLNSSGNQGGPFSPASKDYTLQNTGGVPIKWSVTKTAVWVSFSSPNSGILDPGALQVVTVSINSSANSLTPGSYNDLINFTNGTNDNGSTTRGVVLKVTACNYTIDPGSASYSASGGTGSISVTASASNCSWDAGSNVSWISIQSVTGGVGKVSGKRPKSGAAYLGSGTVNYAVSTNTGPARDGTLTVAGQTVTIHQESGCAYSIDPASTLHASAGGTGSVNVTAGTGCIWTAVSDASWITVTPGWSGTGNGTVNYSVSADTGSARDGTITIAGQTFTIHQEAATYNLTVNVTGSGTVRFEPPGPYAPGTKVIVYFEPTPGSHVSDVIVDGVSIGGVYAVTFTDMSMNHTINVIFE